MPRARVILNPTAGDGRAGTAAERILVGLEHRGIDADIVSTSGPREAVTLGLEAARGAFDIVIAAGGDGTIHEVANGLLRALAQGVDGPVLGVLPVGTGNDFAKLVGPLDDLDASLDVIGAGRVRRFDAAVAEWNGRVQWFVNAAGTGIDVEVVRQVQRQRGRPSPAITKYLTAVIKSLFGYRAIPLRIRLDDEVLDRDTMIIAASNGRCIGGGFWVSPQADPEDGRFDICIVNDLSFVGSLRALPLIMRGKHEKHPKVEMYRSRTVVIEALGPDPIFFQLDGELHEPPDLRALSLRLVPAALPLLVGSAPA